MSTRIINIDGKRIGRLKAVFDVKGNTEKRRLLVRCDCGTFKFVSKSDFNLSKLVSCGCHKKEQTIKRNKINARHNETGSYTYVSWYCMRQRCRDQKSKNAIYYVNKGISVCDEWNDYKNFLKDMGPRPQNHTLDRIDGNLGYNKENCRWATYKQQAENR